MLAHPATHPLERLVVGRHCQEMINEGRSFQVLQTLEPFILICRLLRTGGVNIRDPISRGL
jgi:hypothetical protein